MLETLVALLFAHVLADFVLQTGWMVRHKTNIGVLALHCVIVGATCAITLGQVPVPLLALIVVSHCLIDMLKTHVLPDTWRMFTLDQILHLLMIGIAAVIWPLTYSQGLWADPPEALADALPVGLLVGLPNVMAVATGLILATRTGGFLIGLALRDLDLAPNPETATEDLARGGRIIGELERTIIFGLSVTGNLAGVGFLVAAKSILRFDTTRENRAMSEYVIIGTLLSFGWAMAVGLATTTLLQGLSRP